METCRIALDINTHTKIDTTYLDAIVTALDALRAAAAAAGLEISATALVVSDTRTDVEL